MDIDSAAINYHKKLIIGAVIEPSSNGNGWHVLFHQSDGEMATLTDHRGAEKIYHTLDKATKVIQTAGIHDIRVEEHF